MKYVVILVGREHDGNVCCGKVPAALSPVVGMRLHVGDDKVVVLNAFAAGHDLEETDLPTWQGAAVAAPR